MLTAMLEKNCLIIDVKLVVKQTIIPIIDQVSFAGLLHSQYHKFKKNLHIFWDAKALMIRFMCALFYFVSPRQMFLDLCCMFLFAILGIDPGHSLCSSRFHFLSGKRESREGTGTDVRKKQWKPHEFARLPLGSCFLPLRGNGKDCYAGYPGQNLAKYKHLTKRSISTMQFNARPWAFQNHDYDYRPS